MRTLVLEPTETAQWHMLVTEAAASCDCRLDEGLESYLVFLLMRFAGRPELAASVMALEYLRGMLSLGRLRHEHLRDVGDKCLLYSGLFPRRAERRRVRISYFVDLGQAAYRQLALAPTHAGADLYARLSATFVLLMDVLQAMRGLGDAGLDPLHTLELWNDTGSRRAYQALRRMTDATPVPGDDTKKH